MKLLIVNADDFGVSPARDRGILRAIDDGVVTSVSALANGLDVEPAAREILKRGGAGVGLHFNLSDGPPCGGPYRTLTGEGGAFLGKRLARERAALADRSGFDPEEIAAEFSAQAARLRSLGIEPDHFDGHQHLHVYPGVVEAVVRAARAAGIGRWRLPGPEGMNEAPDRTWLDRVAERDPELLRVAGYAAAARGVGLKTGLRAPDFFMGIALMGFASVEDCEVPLGLRRDGVTEWMVHPGDSDPAAARPFDGPEREAELRVLVDPALREVLRRSSIDLVNYSAVQDAR